MLPTSVTEHIKKEKDKETPKKLPLSTRQSQQSVSNLIISSSLATQPAPNGVQQNG